MKAPAENGTYNPQFCMVWEGHQMFGAANNKTVRVVNGTGPAVGTATASASTAKPTSTTSTQSSPTTTQVQHASATTAAATQTSAGLKLPCLSSVLFPLLGLGVVTIGMSKRKKRGE